MKNANQSPSDYDLIIIGGGIYGCALLWEASHRGLNALLLEKNDYGSGTSANSLKTIHGGIRYLQQLNLKRTIESDQEKVILSRIAPNLIQPLSCALPTAGSLTKNKITYWLASFLFKCLSSINPNGSGRSRNKFNPAALKAKFNLFNDGRATDCMVWQDAQVQCSEQLGLSFIRSALAIGAEAHNYCEVTTIQKSSSDQFIVTAKSNDNHELNYSCKYIADCTSKSQLFKKCTPDIIQSKSSAETYVLGVNLILSEQFSKYALALPSFNQKLDKKGMLFFSPWKDCTLVGTWYFHNNTHPNSNIKNRTATNDIGSELIEVCLSDIQSALKSENIDLSTDTIKQMILDVHAGYLPATDHSNPEKALINKAILVQHGHFFCMQGNKYTTARLNARKLVDRIAINEQKITTSKSHEVVLYGAGRLNNDDPTHSVLFQRYGDLTPELLSIYQDTNVNFDLAPGSSSIYQIEVDYFSSQKDVITLNDLLYRRINHNIHQPISEETVLWCGTAMANKKEWSEDQLNANIDSTLQHEKRKRSYSLQ